jgi:hypothetical protein
MRKRGHEAGTRLDHSLTEAFNSARGNNDRPFGPPDFNIGKSLQLAIGDIDDFALQQIVSMKVHRESVYLVHGMYKEICCAEFHNQAQKSTTISRAEKSRGGGS